MIVTSKEIFDFKCFEIPTRINNKSRWYIYIVESLDKLNKVDVFK